MMRTLDQINVLFPQPVMKWHSLLTPYVFYALTRIIVCHHRGHNKGKRTSGAPGQSKALSSLIGLLKVTWYILQQLWLVFISFFFFLFFFFKNSKKINTALHTNTHTVYRLTHRHTMFKKHQSTTTIHYDYVFV